jgi:nitrogenase-stabilizing/protective protein
MKSLDDFYNSCRDAEDFFKFFDIKFDQALVNVKRFHMMKEYGNLIKRGMTNIEGE